ncbi:caskin-2-like [Sorex araneus]|uniref:caskin-2-like n=1 Tax=Sorex araneus TaxID=42254 RepID=UPI002433F8FE|nr:caskin-2-like [Sorex araneus]XP_055000108.1 caskin-2-like [Sorex araneus]
MPLRTASLASPGSPTSHDPEGFPPSGGVSHGNVCLAVEKLCNEGSALPVLARGNVSFPSKVGPARGRAGPRREAAAARGAGPGRREQRPAPTAPRGRGALAQAPYVTARAGDSLEGAVLFNHYTGPAPAAPPPPLTKWRRPWRTPPTPPRPHFVEASGRCAPTAWAEGAGEPGAAGTRRPWAALRSLPRRRVRPRTRRETARGGGRTGIPAAPLRGRRSGRPPAPDADGR